MLDPKTLSPEVQKLVPQASPEEIADGISQFAKVHPDATNEQALSALMTYLKEQNAPSSPRKPFEGLISTLGAK